MNIALNRTGGRIAYRPDLDGLRAMAVIAVLAFHAFPEWAPGGFWGVDVFFAISGYLITGIILADMSRGSFTLMGFYARRVRRIFPALLAVLLAAGYAGWLMLLPEDHADLGAQITASSVFASNFFFMKGVGYFHPRAELQPLLHLWSLAIEEQFYIVWPLVLLMGLKKKSSLAGILFAIAGASFACNLYWIHTNPVAGFFLPFTRAWELAAGGLLAVAANLYSDRFDRWRPAVRLVIACAGLACILASFLLLGQDRAHPQLHPLAPVFGALLVIAAGPGTYVNSRFLAARLLVACGLVSFPLYLWHWPLLVFARVYTQQGLTRGMLTGLLIAAVVLAILTYRWVEQPLRFGAHGAMKALALVAMMCAAGLAGRAMESGLVPPHSAYFHLEQVLAASRDWGVTYDLEQIDSNYWRSKRGSREDMVLFIGDSHAWQYAPRIDKLIAENPGTSRGALFATRAGCPVLPGVVHVTPGMICDGFLEAARKRAEGPDFSTIVLAGQWSQYLFGQDYAYSYHGVLLPLGYELPSIEKVYADLKAMLMEFRERGKKVVLLLEIPDGPELDPVHLIERRFDLSHGGLDFQIRRSGISVSRLARARGPVPGRMREIGRQVGAEVIDPADFLCRDGFCSATGDNGVPRYYNAAHLRTSFVRDQVQFLDHLMLKAE